MPTRPQSYQSLAAQVAARIATEIKSGTWHEWLPGERTLTDTLQVSRKTLRKALAQLQRDGLLVTTHGLGHQIAPASAAVPAAPRAEISVGLLTPESLENLRPYTALWVDELRALLFENGIRLATFAGHRFFNTRPENALRRLVQQNPQTAWVLAHTNEAIQQWFCDQRVPCVIAGSCHHGHDLPNVDKDNFACCRHAAGAMLRHGHRRVAFLTQQSQRAGDIESEAGFLDGIRRSSHRNIDPVIMRHDGTVAGVNRLLSRLFTQPTPPTALLVANPVYFLSTITFLAQRSLRVPQDVSLVSRDDDTFLAYLTPDPTRYSLNAKTYAKRLLQPLQSLVRGEPVTHPVHRISPTFVPGASLASVP
jgi:DNA-binding LacI/PurR family transcriptional regulator